MAEPAGYRIFRRLARFLAALFYRCVEVAGLERVPSPVDLMFHGPGTFRVGKALVLIGDPVSTSDLGTPASETGGTAVRRLTERLGGALRWLIGTVR